MNKILDRLIERYPELRESVAAIERTYVMITESLERGGMFFVCGNGGSAADSEHIVGELMKGFVKKRPINKELKEQYRELFGDEGTDIAAKLQGGLKAVALTSHPALASAFLNDVDGTLIYAQQLNALGSKGDVLMGISCSGNAGNVKKAMMVAKVKGIQTVLLTGNKKGSCTDFADCVIGAPCCDTYMVQEYHLPIYHALCLMIEEHFYAE